VEADDLSSVLLSADQGVPLRLGTRSLGLYDLCPEAAVFWRAVQQGEVALRYCPTCRRHLHPRRSACPHCWGGSLEWRQARGTGAVYSFSTVHRAPYPEFEPLVPYTVGMVELDEGVHLFARIDAPAEAVSVGLPVRAAFVPWGSGRTLVFRPVGGSAEARR
jgi:uncharacterized OB-fold protein